MDYPRRSVLLVISLLALSMTGVAQTNQWTAIGPEGGAIAAVVQDRVTTGLLYAVVYGAPAQLFRSTDHGLRWTKCWEFETAISCLTVNPRKPGWLYAASGAMQMGMIGGERRDPSRLYESKDQGKSWSSKPFPPIYAVSKIEFDPKEPATIYAIAQAPTTGGVVYLKSTDEGTTWMTTEVLPERGWATTLTVDASHPDILYVGLYPMAMTMDSKFLYKSTNGGRTFSPLTLKTNYISPVNDVVLDPNNPGRIFFLNYGGVFRSVDGGATWQKNKGTMAFPQRLWIDPVNSEHLIATVEKGIAVSDDGGVTFKESGGKLPGSGINSLVLSSGSNPHILVSNSAGIFRTTDFGKTWMPSHQGILSTQVTSLRLATSSPGTLMAGVMSNAVYKTSAAGVASVSWEQLPVFYTCTSIGDIRLTLKKPYKVLAIEGGG